jgi:hypothetical protein
MFTEATRRTDLLFSTLKLQCLAITYHNYEYVSECRLLAISGPPSNPAAREYHNAAHKTTPLADDGW